MKIFILKERQAHEKRVAASPETVKKFISLGASVAVEAGAGESAWIFDADFAAAGATITDRATGLTGADIVLGINGPEATELADFPQGAMLIASLNPYQRPDALEAYAKAGITAIAMELMPRITRAQSMDILSSQANLAGYKAVLEAAQVYDRGMPMMMTAAGTVSAAKVFIMGVGVAGLQAIATARRLGAVVSATDVRLATKEQVESLGGKFVFVDDEEAKAAETAGGYAKEMSEAYKAKQAALIAQHIPKQDIVITTALIPGRPAPRLVTAAHTASMKPGSVIVDLAVEQGGNVEGSVPGETVTTAQGVRIIGPHNMPSRLAADASALFARNLFNFAQGFYNKETKSFAWDWEDELLKAVVVTRNGQRTRSFS